MTAAGETREAPPGKIYLDSYLDGVSGLPAEVCRIFHTIKDISAREQELLETSEKLTARCLEFTPQTSRNATDEQKKELAALREELDAVQGNLLMLGNEKVELTNTAHDLLGGHIELLDEELVKFESEITLSLAEQELNKLHQQQADALAQRDNVRPSASVVAQSAREDSHVKQGDQVAAKISRAGAPDEWILGRVMNISGDHLTYTILDEDADAGGTSSIHHLSPKQVIRLPKPKEKKSSKAFPEGSYVLAMFPDTTMLYRAFVVQTARWQGKNGAWGPYSLAFDDDEDPTNPGYSTNRSVAFQHVVALPRDFKLA
ncbi:SGF29 tudor-like domain-containing protein [Chloropicon primus]|uniref:SGF29 tudor-like domain-containing protein n=2 Tax=Chloropicon primus TaxID=1764295 RepID=A0A5B8MBT0_9CHLO|nr:SGF29 tudor-like domain-containing protein [Chloropicon primus]UPQ97053.1 SGF29 tudor-like domain-containing protein [Chloropicon primus]|eukprot:QDZ17837.1 SGF29 tudor-like domain-containing protein [Chloropicon primus]